MVTVFLRGGLGNQMFQYAAGLSLAKKNKTTVALDIVHILDRFPRPRFAYRTYDLSEVFMIQPSTTRLSKIARALPLPGIWLGLDLLAMQLRQAMGRSKMVYEDGAKGFNPAIFDVRGDAILYGRWESQKYFSDVAADVRSAFNFRYELEGEAAQIAEAIRTTNSISLHVRRGDFVNLSAEGRPFETHHAYYEKAIQQMAARVSDPHFFIFSDDIAWCKKNISLRFPTTYLENSSAGPKGGFHLHLMSLAKHNIICNSTFSWWGAWLNKNKEKIVIAPKSWPQLSNAGEKDIVPEGWIAL